MKNIKLQATREASVKTQAQVAKEAGMPLQQYQRYEYGTRKPSVTTAIRIAEALRIKSFSEFKRIFGADTPTPTE